MACWCCPASWRATVRPRRCAAAAISATRWPDGSSAATCGSTNLRVAAMADALDDCSSAPAQGLHRRLEPWRAAGARDRQAAARDGPPGHLAGQPDQSRPPPYQCRAAVRGAQRQVPEPQRAGGSTIWHAAAGAPTSIYTRSDGVVGWRGSLQPEGPRARERRSAREPLRAGRNPLVMLVVADRLAQRAGEWQPFAAKGISKLLFPHPSH